ncbi:hypothetical protein GCM10025879_21580 [Leuconostoc litchii]|uniref:hypothetical protein n=1 Tax=Leuconostoc litchii TaxID=1981069 RepID=UPI0023E97E3C|nr:hypothetical protein [Leuconostoc litchii]GMA70910.1 hypothetical protein GCM10025879_21580 [Leuconostoc litchii]
MAEVDDEDVVYDLGSGDGRIVIEATQKYHAWGVGVEADPLCVLVPAEDQETGTARSGENHLGQPVPSEHQPCHGSYPFSLGKNQ